MRYTVNGAEKRSGLSATKEVIMAGGSFTPKRFPYVTFGDDGDPDQFEALKEWARRAEHAWENSINSGRADYKEAYAIQALAACAMAELYRAR
jgi:hypothetical protein